MKTLLFGGLVAAAAISSQASAGIEVGDTVILSRTGSFGFSAQYEYVSSRAWNASASGSASTSQAHLMTFSPSGGGSISAFCIEVVENYPDDPITYQAVEISQVPENSPPGALSEVAQTLIQDLYAKFYSSNILNAPTNAFDRKTNYAAFQLLIWEISHENFDTTDASVAVTRMDLTQGAFVGASNQETMNLASSMIASLGNGGFSAYSKLIGLTNPNNQDLLIVVPTPAIAGLAGLGLAGMRRRRR